MAKLTVNALSINEQAVKLSNNHSSLDSLGLRDIGNELSSPETANESLIDLIRHSD